MKEKMTALLIVLILLVKPNQAIFGSPRELPYSLGVRDSFMIGHSFRGNPDFGPAANMVSDLFISYISCYSTFCTETINHGCNTKLNLWQFLKHQTIL